MNYIHYLLQRMGKWGIILSSLASLAFIALLYWGVIGGEYLDPLERLLISSFLILFLAYQLFSQLKSVDNLDESLFFSYPLTTLGDVEQNAKDKGVKSFYIGKVAELKRFAEWKSIAQHLRWAVNLKRSYHPDAEHHGNTSVSTFLPADNVLGVKYADDLYQFVQLRTVSNDVHQAIQMINEHGDRGVRVDGNYEHLKNAPEQFTRKSWLKIMLVIFVGTVTFIVVSVYVSHRYL